MRCGARCGHRNAPVVQDDDMKWIQSCPMKTVDTSETLQVPVRLASHRLAVLRLALTLCALGASSDPLRFVLPPSINCAPVLTAWARGAREGLSLSLRARSLPVAFRASDVVVHVQGAQAGTLSTLLSSQGHLSICSGPHPRVRAMDVLGSSVQVLHVFPVALPTDQVFCTNSIFPITRLTWCGIFLVAPSGKEERQRIPLKLCRVCKDLFRSVRSRDKSKQLLKSCQELQWHRDTSVLHRS